MTRIDGYASVMCAGASEAVDPAAAVVQLDAEFVSGTRKRAWYQSTGPAKREILAAALTAYALNVKVHFDVTSEDEYSEITALWVHRS